MKRVLVGSFLVLAGTYGIKANAQEVGQPSYFQRSMAAPARAFEIGVSGMYNQGWGNLTDTASPVAGTTGRRLQDVGGAGIGAEIALGYRVAPAFGLGVFAQGSEYDADTRLATGTNVRSLVAGIQGNWFSGLYRTINPWVNLGSAYRGLWIVPEVAGITSYQGWQIARLQIGVDMRASRSVSIGPYVNGSIDMFFSEGLPNAEREEPGRTAGRRILRRRSHRSLRSRGHLPRARGHGGRQSGSLIQISGASLSKRRPPGRPPRRSPGGPARRHCGRARTVRPVSASAVVISQGPSERRTHRVVSLVPRCSFRAAPRTSMARWGVVPERGWLVGNDAPWTSTTRRDGAR